MDEGLDPAQIEAAIGVVSMFNYFTRVADATGIDFDYTTPLPAFQPDLGQASAPRPPRSAAPGGEKPGSEKPGSEESGAEGPGGQSGDTGRARPGHPLLQRAWATWHGYVTESEQPITVRERRLLAAVAAEESTDWAVADALAVSGAVPGDAPGHRDQVLIGLARKISREPWSMRAADLDGLRAAGFADPAILHAISVAAHQNADSRLALGLAVAQSL